jgi:hypothetical protein
MGDTINWGIFKRHFWGELLRHQHTFSTSAVAVCCCSGSRSSFSSRVFSMAMTAWLAKLVTSAICLSLNGRGRGRTKTGRLWVYTRDDPPSGGPDPPAAVYLYSPDRAATRLTMLPRAVSRSNPA